MIHCLNLFVLILTTTHVVLQERSRTGSSNVVKPLLTYIYVIGRKNYTVYYCMYTIRNTSLLVVLPYVALIVKMEESNIQYFTTVLHLTVYVVKLHAYRIRCSLNSCS